MPENEDAIDKEQKSNVPPAQPIGEFAIASSDITDVLNDDGTVKEQ